MDYSIAKGDTLWSIAKNHYNCASDADIARMVSEIQKENNIKNPNLIYAGAGLVLPENDFFKSSDASNVDEFDEWTGDENYKKLVNGEEIEDFEMFDFDVTTYSSDLKDFSQEYIDKYDEDGDGVWSRAEFISMADTSGFTPEQLQQGAAMYDQIETIYADRVVPAFDDDGDGKLNDLEIANYLGLDLSNPASQELLSRAIEIYDRDGDLDNVNLQELMEMSESLKDPNFENVIVAKELNDMYNNAFDALNLDADTESINAGEYAAMLHTADINWETYYESGENLGASVDGKLNYLDYAAFSSLLPGDEGYETIESHREGFYNNFYAEKK